MRLIDADKFEKFIQQKYKDGEKTEDIKYQMLFDLSYQQTAYDADKVVEQLEELKENYKKVIENIYCRSTETDDCDSCRADHYLQARLSAIDSTIEIVKGGGVNE